MRIGEFIQKLVPTTEDCNQIAAARSASFAHSLGRGPVSSCSSCEVLTATERKGAQVTDFYANLPEDGPVPPYEEADHNFRDLIQPRVEHE
jgi:hypothetical protein